MRTLNLSRESLKVLLNLINQNRTHGWGATTEVLVFLFWLASGASYRVVSRVFAIPRATVHHIVHRVTEEVMAVHHQVIHLPQTPEDLGVMSHGFAGLARHRAFLKAAGAIDGCHVCIKPPSGHDGQCYRNRKLFLSVILQVVCGHQVCFIDTYVGWPGSVHDSRVLRNSPLYRQARYPPPGHFILAHGEYPSPTSTPPHHSLQEAIPSCLGAGDVVAPEYEPEDDVPDEGETGLEAVSGALWQDQLSALEVPSLDHDDC
ncbi:ryanodine receptor 1 [Sarotherodon galilaeus]